MTTLNTGSRRPTTDTTHAPPDLVRHDEAAPDRGAQSDPGQIHTAKPSSTNLVLPRSPLIGRDHEIAAVQHLLLQERVGLLTLTGPGGIGKTRLAMQVAATLLDHFVDGVYFVSLAPIRNADLVSVAIAETLGVSEGGGQSIMEALQAYLQHRQMLLVLDNFEQVLAAAPLVALLLTTCDRLKIMVTSRATLHLYGEQEFPVPPLALPDSKRLKAMGVALVPSLAQVASVTLFVQRAMAVQPDFALNATNEAAVAEICIGVDGLPLAIELAAAKIKLFSPPALLARLQQRLTLLTGGSHDMPARQRTLRDEIAWSYDLLAPAEQVLFRRLALFAGGFTLEAAQAVCSDAGDLGLDVLDGVTSLVDQNLLKRVEPAHGTDGQPLALESRFDMLEMVREYALEQLNASGEVETIRHLHLSFFLTLAEQSSVDQVGAVRGTWLSQMRMEHDNLRVALAWSLAKGSLAEASLEDANNVEMASRLTSALTYFWILNGYWREGRHWLEAALALTKPAERTQTRVIRLANVGRLAVFLDDLPAAHAWLTEGLDIARELDIKPYIHQCLVTLSWISRVQHDHALALAQLEEALLIARGIDNKYETASTLIFLGNLARDEDDFARAQALYEEGLALFEEIGADFDAIDVLSWLGLLAEAQGDNARAEEFFRESLAGWQAMGTLQWIRVTICLEGLARVYVLHHHFAVAAHLFGAADALRELTGGTPVSPSSAEGGRAAVRAELGEAAFAEAWQSGHALSVEEAVASLLALPTLSAAAANPSDLRPLPSITYPGGLTAREVEVLRLLAQGLTYVQIGEKLIISHRTVNAHLITIYAKLEVHTRWEAIQFAQDHQLL